MERRLTPPGAIAGHGYGAVGRDRETGSIFGHWRKILMPRRIQRYPEQLNPSLKPDGQCGGSIRCRSSIGSRYSVGRGYPEYLGHRSPETRQDLIWGVLMRGRGSREGRKAGLSRGICRKYYWSPSQVPDVQCPASGHLRAGEVFPDRSRLLPTWNPSSSALPAPADHPQPHPARYVAAASWPPAA